MPDSEKLLFVLARIREAAQSEVTDMHASSDVLERINQLANDELQKMKYYRKHTDFANAVWQTATENRANIFTASIRQFRTVLDKDGTTSVEVMSFSDVQTWLGSWNITSHLGEPEVQEILDKVGQPYLVERSWAESEEETT